jgi:AcrR family transcriptional regulator
MARKPQRSARAGAGSARPGAGSARPAAGSARAAKAAPALPPPGGTDRDRIIAALMALLGEKRFEEIGFGDIARRADVSLGVLRGEFGSTLAILAARAKELDRKVLAGHDADMAEEPARERLFDVLMRRIEAMAPYREATRSLLRSACANPALALALNGIAVRSQTWMLEAAGIDAAGPRGAIRAQGMAALFAGVLRVWVDDDDAGLARTLAALDRALARGQSWSGALDGLCRFTPGHFFGRGRRRHDAAEDEEPAAA